LFTSEYFEYRGETSGGRDWYFANASFRSDESQEGPPVASDSTYFESIDDRLIVAK
jgi:hypothetical protein